MRSPTQTKAESSFTPIQTGLLQRKCTSCGQHTIAGGECTECKNRRSPLQRLSTNQAEPSEVPPIVHEVLRSPGHPLDGQTRAFMESRFGYDFSQVRVHTDAQAAESANAVNATAYTVGRNITFGRAQYAPQTIQGKHLLAHELAHVVQQGGSRRNLNEKIAPNSVGIRHEVDAGQSTTSPLLSKSTLAIGRPNDSYEQEADAAADAVVSMSSPDVVARSTTSGVLRRSIAPLLQRRLVVNPGDSVPLPAGFVGPPPPLTLAIQGLLADTCPDGQFQVDARTGNVTTPLTRFCEQPPPPIPYLAADISSTPVGCRCICDVINNVQTTTIAFSPGGPSTSPGSVPGAGPGQGGVATSPTVNLDPRFQGQYRIGSRWLDVPFHLLLSHELCGHALPKMRGTHVARGAPPPGGTPPQEQHAVDIERQIAAEHNPPLPRRPEDYSGGARQRP